MRKDLESFYTVPDDDYAYAMVAGRNRGRSANAKSYPELKSWLVETADVFRDEVLPFFEDGGVVLTSATLASTPPSAGESRSFSYARRRLGLDEVMEGATDSNNDADDGLPVSEFAGAEVFDYENRVLIYAENGSRREIPEPTFGNVDAFTHGCIRNLYENVKPQIGPQR